MLRPRTLRTPPKNGGSMGHRQLVERWFSELWGGGDEGVIDELMADDCMNVGLDGANGRAGFRGFYRGFRAAFPKIDIAVEDFVEQGERWSAACRAELTNARGEEHTISGAVMGVVRSGKFVETRNEWNFARLLESTKTIEPGLIPVMLEAQIEGAATRPKAAMTHLAFWERWFDELYSKKRPAIIDECVSDDCVIVGLPRTTNGRESFHGFYKAFSAAFPWVRIVVEDCVEDGERFAIRCSGQVDDHDGKRHAFTGCCYGRIRGGRVVEAYNQWDFLSLLGSMGVVPKAALAETIEAEAKRATS
jgi:hypothetical protein